MLRLFNCHIRWHRPHHRSRRFVTFAALLCAAFFLSSDHQAANADVIYSDDFSSSTLGTGWTFIDPRANSSYSLTAVSGHLQIAVPTGSEHDCWGSVNNCARMLRGAANDDAVYETKIDGINIGSQYQTYGIMLEQNTSNYLRFEYWSDASGAKVAAWKTISNGGSNAIGVQPVTMGNANYLRVTKTGTTYKLEYSQNGSSWALAGSFTQAGFTVNRSGLYVINAGTNPQTIANFDYFTVQGGGTPPTFSLSLTKTGAGSGTVTSNPSGINCGSDCSEAYNSGTVVTLTASADANSTFNGWSGGGCSGTGTCTVTMTAAATVNADFPSSLLPTNAVAHWKFDEGTGNVAADSSGNGHTASLLGGAGWTAGRVGSGAVNLDGVDDYGQSPDTAALRLGGGALSVAAWVRYTATGGHQMIIAKPASATAHVSPYFAYSLHILAGGTPRFWLTLNNVGRNVSGPSLSTGTWHHLAGVWDGSVMRLYVNGVEAGSVSASGTLPAFTTPLRIGTNGGLSEKFKGSMDNVKIYSRALTAAEIQSLAGGAP